MALPEGDVQYLVLNSDLKTWFPARPISCWFPSALITTLETALTQDSPPHSSWGTVSLNYCWNTPSFPKTSGSEVCSCCLTGYHVKCWLKQEEQMWTLLWKRSDGKRTKVTGGRWYSGLLLEWVWRVPPCWKQKFSSAFVGSSSKSKFRKRWLRKHSQNAANLLLLYCIVE